MDETYSFVTNCKGIVVLEKSGILYRDYMGMMAKENGNYHKKGI